MFELLVYNRFSHTFLLYENSIFIYYSAKFSSCLSSGKFADDVKADLEYGSQIGVGGTPAFFINGRIISGACPAQTFTSAIDAELDGDDWAVTNCQFVKL